MKKCPLLILAIFFAGILAAGEKVLTIALDDHLDTKDDRAMSERFIKSLKGRGIDANWSSPPAGRPGSWEDPKFIDFTKWANDLYRQNGVMVILSVRPGGLISPRDGEEMRGFTLDPKTGLRQSMRKSWDYADPAAVSEFLRRLEQYINATAPYEGYLIDEEILIDQGPNWYETGMGQYWTSPTYSDASLESFRRFVKEHCYFIDGREVKFPVTTKVLPSEGRWEADMPAIPITAANEAYLQEDNDYPKSVLWTAWFDWRTQILMDFYQKQFQLAKRMLGNNPDWLGCFCSAPDGWFCRETALDKFRLASMPEVDWIVAGYCSGMRMKNLKDATDHFGKKLGGMVEFSRYGNPEIRTTTVEDFKWQVENGAQCILVYPLSNLYEERTEDWLQKSGLAYHPAAPEIWKKCVEFLNTTGRTWKDQ